MRRTRYKKRNKKKKQIKTIFTHHFKDKIKSKNSENRSTEN
jgi:hypothetical protein